MSIHVYGSLIEWELPRYCTPFWPASADFASYRRKMIVIVCVCGPMAQVATKEGCLMKQTSSFQRWRRRYFKLKGRTLYYAKDTKVSPNNRCPINQPPPPQKKKKITILRPHQLFDFLVLSTKLCIVFFIVFSLASRGRLRPRERLQTKRLNDTCIYGEAWFLSSFT